MKTKLDEFERSVDGMSKSVHNVAVSKGWWENERNRGEMIALMHSELSEALEADRAGNPPSEKIPEFSHVTEELADCVIRIMDFVQHTGESLGKAITAKIAYNEGRAYKHGSKKY